MRIDLRLPAAILAGLAAAAAGPAPERYVVYYGADAPASAFADFGIAVLDSDRHPDLAPLRQAGKQLFGYLSLGEIEASRPYFAEAKSAGLLLAANPTWPDARYVDLRKPAWHAMVLDRLIPAILARGFGGLFLDTLDDAGTLESEDKRRNAGMVAAAADLVHEIHARYPAVPLMLNRAYDVARTVAPDLDSVVAESLSSTYDFGTKRYHVRTAPDLQWGLDRIAELRRANPALRLFALDYWNPDDPAGIARLYAQERRAGLIPYVATIDLQRIVPEPAARLGWR